MVERSRSNRYLISTTAVLGVTLGTIFGIRGCTNEQSKPEPFSSTTTTPRSAKPELSSSTTPINPELTRSTEIEQLLATSSEIQKQILLQNYLSVSDEFQRIFARQITFDYRRLGNLNPEVINSINRQAIEHVADGANLAKSLLPPEEAVKIRLDGTRQQLTIDNLELNLNNDLQLHLAASLVRLKIEALLASDKINQRLVRDEVENLQWLARTNPPIIIESGSFAILPKKTLVVTARLLRSFQEAKIPAPREIYFKNWQLGDPGGAWYESLAYPHPLRITVTNVSDEEGLVHEAGHHVSGVWLLDPNNTQLASFSQESFAAMIRQIQERHQITEPITKEKNLAEEYANTFFRYYREGDQFRREIITTEPGSIKRVVLLSEYQFMKALWQGRESSQNGIPVERLDQHETINIGDVIEITDTDLEKPGIFLRSAPTLEIGPNLPTVWDNYKLLIIDGPVKVTDQFGNTHEMWKVKLGATSYGGDIFFAPRDLEHYPEGWISREWFGRKITFKEIRTN